MGGVKTTSAELESYLYTDLNGRPLQVQMFRSKTKGDHKRGKERLKEGNRGRGTGGGGMGTWLQRLKETKHKSQERMRCLF